MTREGTGIVRDEHVHQPACRRVSACTMRAIINSKYIINIILEQMPNNNKKIFTAKTEITLTKLKVLYAK
jgi:hypothetical protein